MEKKYDTSDLDRDLYRWLIPRLKQFKVKCHKYTDDYKTEDGKFYKVLDKIIIGCELALEQSMDKKDMKKQEDGLLLLGKYLPHLWW